MVGLVNRMASLRLPMARPALVFARSTMPIPRISNLVVGVGRYSRPILTSSPLQSQRTKFINALIDENGPGKLLATYKLNGRLQINRD